VNTFEPCQGDPRVSDPHRPRTPRRCRGHPRSTGHPDGSGLSVNRYYDPATGQFLSVDPLVDETDQAYGYTGGDPVINSDPSGRDLNPENDLGPLGADEEAITVRDPIETVVKGIGSDVTNTFERGWDDAFGGGESVATAPDSPTGNSCGVSGSSSGTHGGGGADFVANSNGVVISTSRSLLEVDSRTRVSRPKRHEP
jgi:RHS repeat-associated protein